jgi:lipid-A-disaccharide synthase
MRQCVDHVAVVLPFETEIYRRAGIPVEFVGHPFIVDHELPDPIPQAHRDGIALLPGSRPTEVRQMLPVITAAAQEIARARPGIRFVIAKSPVVDEEDYAPALRACDARLERDAVAALSSARAAVVASGTATLQAALLETPLVVVYRTTAINYALARRMVTIENIGLVNVLLGERVAPELVQDEARAPAVARTLLDIAEDEPRREAMLRRFRELRTSLAGGGGAERVAELALALVKRTNA